MSEGNSYGGTVTEATRHAYQYPLNSHPQPIPSGSGQSGREGTGPGPDLYSGYSFQYTQSQPQPQPQPPLHSKPQFHLQTETQQQQHLHPWVLGQGANIGEAQARKESGEIDGYLKVYVSNLAKALTDENLHETLAELNSIKTAQKSGPKSTPNSNPSSQAQIHFLAQLLSEFILHIETSNVAKLPNRQAKASALESILHDLSSQQDFCTVICSSLYQATNFDPQVQALGRNDNVGLTFSSLVQYLTTPQKRSQNSNSGSLSNTGIVTFTAGVFSGWHFENKDLILDLASRILLSSLEKEDIGGLSQVLRENILLAFTATEAINDSNSSVRKIVEELSSYTTCTLTTTTNNTNMAERLSPAGAGLITNLLAELGPACTQNVSTLRDTIRGITRNLQNTNAINSKAIDEQAMARLIYFFSERGTKGGTAAGSGNAALGTLTNDFDIPEGSEWKLGNVATVFSEDYSHLNWDEVANRFDFDGFKIHDPTHFRACLFLYKAGAMKSLSQNVMVKPWMNKSGQLSLVENALAVPNSIFSFSLNQDEEKDAATTDDTPNATCLNRKGWASAAILQLLLDLSESAEVAQRVRNLFIQGLNAYPEVLLCALVRLPVRQGVNSKKVPRIKNELMHGLMKLFFTQSQVRNGPLAIKRLWSISETTVVMFCIEAWRATPKEMKLVGLHHILRVLNHASPNWKVQVLNSNKDSEFNLALACVMADHNLLELRPYLDSQVSHFGLPFIMAMVSYISKNHQNASEKNPVLSAGNLALGLSYLRGLDSNILNQKIQQDSATENSVTLAESIKALSNACLSANPSLGARLSAPSPTPATSDEIEEAANSYFQQIYTSEKSIDDVVKMLKRFKTSPDRKEKDIFACMIHNLFDEYRFFSKYPDKELRITGILFGKLIQEQLVSSITLGIALRYVLEALRKEDNNRKMFNFGMFALEQFKDRLDEWPQYCSHIVQIKHLKEGYKKLVAEIEEAMVENQNRSTSNTSLGSTTNDSASASSDAKNVGPGVPSTVSVQLGASNGSSHSVLESIPVTPKKREAVFGPGLGRAVTEMNEDVSHDAPNNKALDRVQHLMNNVTIVNAEQTANDIKNILDAKNFGWLGQYLVVKRISTQPNYHHVYLAFLEHLGDYGKELIQAILSSVYNNVGTLLNSPEITTSSSQRSLLKNLGTWLGLITLARNKPILQITLDCKELLYQGYETGRLFAVTPFVAKILEGAKNSQVFRPPNPWLMGLLSVFRSLYEVKDLKMNIKFEVEVLCKNLGLTLGEIPLRTEELAKRIPPVKTSNPDFNIKNGMGGAPTPSAGQTTPNPESKNRGSMSAGDAPPLKLGAPSPAPTGAKDQQTVIPNLASYVTINRQLMQLFQQLGSSSKLEDSTLERTVPLAVDRAIREIIQPVVERSVTIACITTKEIVTKDFAMEGDETKMRKAAQLMVANLAGSLALVACREPLKLAVSNNLRQLLVDAATGNQTGSSDASKTRLSDPVQNAIDHCVSVVSQENLELGCTLIEKAATEKAVRDIEECLAPDLLKRQRHREISGGKPFHDMSIFGNQQRYPNALPEPLRPKPGGLRNEQLLVYEAFQRIPRQPSAQQQATSTSTAGGSSTPGNEGVKQNTRFNVEHISSIAMRLESAVTNLLNQFGPRAPEITLGRIPVEHEIKQLIMASNKMMAAVAASGALTTFENDAALGFAQTIFKRLYELRLSEPLRLEAFVALLESLNICCRQLEKDLGTWATYAPTDTDAKRKLHRTVLLLLLRSKLLQVSELDSYLCDHVNGGRDNVWLEFTMAFIRTAVHEAIIDHKELPKTMRSLIELGKSGGQSNLSNQIAQLLHAVDEKSSRAKDRATPDNSMKSAPASIAPGDSVTKNATHQQSSSISPESLSNLAGATSRAFESIEAISRKDPKGLKERILILLDGWMRIINDVSNSEQMLQYVQLLQQNGIGNNEEQSERFFRVSTEVLVAAVLKDSMEKKALNYSVIDGYCMLIVSLMKHLNSGGNPDEVANQRISLLNQVLGVTMRTMMAHYERSKRCNGPMKWDQRPWFRLLLNLLMDLNAPSPVFDSISHTILNVFGSAFHVVQPLVMPGFAFAWLELVSHRMFLSNLLSQKGQKGWALANQLLIDLFLFLEPHLRKMDLTDSMRQLYNGTMRVLLVLLHDYPAFLAGYHLSFCNVIPENCVQLRNLVLSAFPRGMLLPDPFTPNLKIDVIPEMSKSPIVLSNVVGPITAIRDDLDDYLKTRKSPNFIATLLPRLCRDGTKDVDAGKINALVLYVGMNAIAKQQSSQNLHSTAEIQVLQKLMDFDDRGRYISLNAIANQLRFPSNHTHYFSCVMLFLFSEAKDEGVREQVTRVLLERLIVHRPHPWGLLVTFIELIKNTRYRFWSHNFTRCAAEIEKLFESVARSCLTPGSQKTTSIGDA